MAAFNSGRASWTRLSHLPANAPACPSIAGLVVIYGVEDLSREEAFPLSPVMEILSPGCTRLVYPRRDTIKKLRSARGVTVDLDRGKWITQT